MKHTLHLIMAPLLHVKQRMITGCAEAAVWDLGHSLHYLEEGLRNILISMLSWKSICGRYTSIILSKKRKTLLLILFLSLALQSSVMVAT